MSVGEERGNMSGTLGIVEKRRSPRQANRPTTVTSANRKSLKTLQHVASDKENKTLVGRNPFTLSKKNPKGELKYTPDSKQKKMTNAGIQVEVRNKVTTEDLISDAGPSENYWESLAEKRRLHLGEALKENKMLHEEIEKLKVENQILREMIEDSKEVVDVLQEMINEQEESGIGLGDESCLSINNSAAETDPSSS